MGLKIISTGEAVPRNTVSNDQISGFLDTSDEWITARTGVKSRHISSGETLTDLCVEAAQRALDKSELDISQIDLIICATICGDYLFPSLACCVAERFETVCPAFDINAACSGFIYALDVANGYLSTGKARNILIISAEMISKLTDWTDRSSCVLFGDGAAACIVTKGDALKYIHLTATGNSKFLYMPMGSGNSPFREKIETGFLSMHGQEIFKFAVSMIESESILALEELKMTFDDIDYFVLHQANKRIIESARNRLKQPENKFPTNIERYGNVSSASMPLVLNKMIDEGKIKKGTKLLLSAFGAGLTTGTCVMIWE